MKISRRFATMSVATAFVASCFVLSSTAVASAATPAADSNLCTVAPIGDEPVRGLDLKCASPAGRHRMHMHCMGDTVASSHWINGEWANGAQETRTMCAKGSSPAQHEIEFGQ
ncbi:hypothetical protein [Pseudonocardia spinosispora]|uniref:hypothetical protein n=1 Tax=Pseudonocardia spinosispora TaxID=103441 RepID=UPI000424A8A9|nr:hypothetical protein [Pseudonocardia spinosispora]